MAKEMGDIVRFDPAPQPAWGAILIAVLAGVTVINALAFIITVQMGFNHPIEDQTKQGILLGNVFLGMALILILYRRFFVDDILIVKKRHPKYEDFIEKYDIE